MQVLSIEWGEDPEWVSQEGHGLEITSIALTEAAQAAEITTQNGGTYEQVFSLEMEKAKAGKVKNTPWGSSFRAPPQILHGEFELLHFEPWPPSFGGNLLMYPVCASPLKAMIGK